MIQIALINQSTVVADADVPAVAAALQRQVSEHFALAWGIDAQLIAVSHGATPDPAAWQLVILDDSNQAAALGYHETGAAGLPLGKVFARTGAQDGEAWSVIASHELLEMLADPEINLTVMIQDSAATGRLYAYEVADPVEGATYFIDGVQVSDFVLPSYFEGGTQGASPTAPFDFLGQLKAPLPAMLPGGYLSVFTTGQDSGWTQVTDMRAEARRMAPASGSRRHRRMVPRSAWRRSAMVLNVAPSTRPASRMAPRHSHRRDNS